DSEPQDHRQLQEFWQQPWPLFCTKILGLINLIA
ncbi:MAG: hypothetical protein RLZZ176_1024, partial [Cyanobacteriota bacterium]